MQITRVHWMIGIALALGALVYFDFAETPRAPTAPLAKVPATRIAPPAAAVSSAAGNPLAPLRIVDLSETLARPVFEPSRRPIERAHVVAPLPPPRASAPPPPAEPNFKLLGVIINGDRSLAVLSTGDGRPQRLEIGDSLNGWQVTTINLNEVVLARGSGRQTLRMSRR